jgi:hypothetical protein
MKHASFMLHFFFLSLVVFASHITPHISEDSVLAIRLSQLNVIETEDSFFYILSAGDSCISGADRNSLDFRTFIGGIEALINRQGLHPCYSIQQRDFLLAMLARIIRSKKYRYLNGIDISERLDKLFLSLSSLPDLQDKETPLIKMLMARLDGIRFISDTDDLVAMKKFLDNFVYFPSFSSANLLKFDLSDWLYRSSYLVHDYSAYETRKALKFAIEYYNKFNYSQEEVLVLYLHVTQVRFFRSGDFRETCKILKVMGVVVEMILEIYNSPTNKLLVGVLLTLVRKASQFEEDVKDIWFSAKEKLAIGVAVSNRDLTSLGGPVNLLSRSVASMLGCEDDRKYFRDLLSRKEWDRFCPGVDIVRNFKYDN